MGEDIHFRCYVKSKKTGKYINAHEICHWDPNGTMFESPVSGRNYDMFSLFGSSRGRYRELSYANYGIPEFLKGSDFDDYCMETGYYGFVWFKLGDFVKAVDEYLAKLKNPELYLDEDDEERENWIKLAAKAGNSEKDRAKFAAAAYEWFDCNREIVESLCEIRENLQFYELLAQPSENDSRFDVYRDLIDAGETVFLFFFDN